MLYLGIDQHARQLTISLRDESGDVLQGVQKWFGYQFYSFGLSLCLPGHTHAE